MRCANNKILITKGKEDMVDQSLPMETVIKLTQLDIKCKLSHEENKHYKLIIDTTGNAEVFFRYKAHLVEVNKLSLGISLGRTTKEEAVEQIRKSIVYCMRAGERLVLQCGKGVVDFREKFDSGPDTLPIDLLFNRAEWRKESNYRRIVRADEDHDLMGNKKCYFMNEEFDIIVLSENEDNDEDVKSGVIAAIQPNLKGSFDIYKIE
ncbi:hypothetical protein FGO68_gene5758 [Halteria grandinella]|uniref:Uncharacterized protein n=1 Tax=Halteria grandinella TaxID=5974 RepID=A0A8J8NIC6_HALGN|nr:hypothetical protein FGO68_gene5758 [Halteria grandinella]